MPDSGTVRIPFGQLSFDGGVDSSRPTTIAGPNMPDGLPRNSLSWANNCTMRGGGITQRTGFVRVCKIHDSTGLYNGGFMYEQTTGTPYLIVAISGRFYRIRVDTDNSIDDITGANVFPATEPFYHFVQGEEFMVVQAGDYTTNPLFWDGVTMRQSNGITGITGVLPPFSPTVVVYSLTITAPFVYPAVAATVVVNLASPYPGSLNDVGTLGLAGTFKVTVIAGNTITIETISSAYVGVTQPAPQVAPFTTTTAPPPASAVGLINEIPAAGPMVYYQGRIWYAQFRQYTAGDIVRGPSGTAPYNLRDSILKVTENPLALAGDGFAVPSQAGNIRALQYTANLDKQLGEGTLYIFTRQQVYANDIPITRANWIAATSNTPANQRVVQRKNGGVSDRSIVAANGDLFYQSLEPGIRSLFISLRNFQQWGNAQISNNIERALAFNDRALMRFSSGIEFGSRMYQAILPEQRAQGVVSRGIATLDFDPITTLGEKQPPDWEGLYEGMDVLQLFVGDFGGRERAFAVIVSKDDDGIELWEITNDKKFDNVDTRVQWTVEFPAYTWDREFDLKRLDGGELWIDKLFGQVDMKFYYRSDANPCWQLWHAVRFCTARTSCETITDPVCYPLETLREGGKFPVTLPVPPLAPCDFLNSRPMNIAHQFQMKVVITGWCRIRGIILYAVPVLKQPFGNLECMPGPTSVRL